jgi:hypothetical protein
MRKAADRRRSALSCFATLNNLIYNYISVFKKFGFQHRKFRLNSIFDVE